MPREAIGTGGTDLSTSPQTRIEFDQIYREHLANVYQGAGRYDSPPELSVPILNTEVPEDRDTQYPAPIGSRDNAEQVNGVVDSYFEWLGAGLYKRRCSDQGSMHGKRALVRELRITAPVATKMAIPSFVRIEFRGRGALEGIEGLETSTQSSWRR